jgi:antibiotic biosynthesis monooxygenase (ABM) superfamily enzyme
MAGAEETDVTDTRPGILAIFNNVAPGREAEFEEWFQHEHLVERLAVPGFLLGRRYEQNVGLHDEGARDRRALVHAAGELVRVGADETL